MHGWYEILNSSCKMRDFGKFCRLQDIQPTRVPQDITVRLDTVSRNKYHVLEFSETNCMSSMKYNSWLSKAWHILTRFQSPLPIASLLCMSGWVSIRHPCRGVTFRDILCKARVTVIVALWRWNTFHIRNITTLINYSPSLRPDSRIAKFLQRWW